MKKEQRDEDAEFHFDAVRTIRAMCESEACSSNDERMHIVKMVLADPFSGYRSTPRSNAETAELKGYYHELEMKQLFRFILPKIKLFASSLSGEERSHYIEYVATEAEKENKQDVLAWAQCETLNDTLARTDTLLASVSGEGPRTIFNEERAFRKDLYEKYQDLYQQNQRRPSVELVAPMLDPPLTASTLKRRRRRWGIPWPPPPPIK